MANPLSKAASVTPVGRAVNFAKKAGVSKKKTPKKMNGIGFWFMVGLAIIKDALDLFLNLTLILVLLVLPISFLLSCAVFTYLYFQGVKMDTRKLATLIGGFLVDAIPLLSIFPIFTTSLFIIRWIENMEYKKQNS